MPPLPVEIENSLKIYESKNDKWSKGIWNLFRKEGAYKYAAINFSLAEAAVIITGKPGTRICISTLFFTVDGQTDIIFYDGEIAISGPMSFGGVSEPRGMVIPLGIFPIELGVGVDFKIESLIAVQVAGTVIYTQE